MNAAVEDFGSSYTITGFLYKRYSGAAVAAAKGLALTFRARR